MLCPYKRRRDPATQSSLTLCWRSLGGKSKEFRYTPNVRVDPAESTPAYIAAKENRNVTIMDMVSHYRFQSNGNVLKRKCCDISTLRNSCLWNFFACTLWLDLGSVPRGSGCRQVVLCDLTESSFRRKDSIVHPLFFVEVESLPSYVWLLESSSLMNINLSLVSPFDIVNFGFLSRALANAARMAKILLKWPIRPVSYG